MQHAEKRELNSFQKMNGEVYPPRFFIYNFFMKQEDYETNKDSQNPSHKKEIPRLNRAIGQLEGIKKMIEEQRYCPDIIIQLKAVRSAIKHIESNILKTHLEDCVAASFMDKEDAKQKILEIKNLLDKMQS